MRPKTFPAAPYVGNTRQRLQEIKEGLKQPAKLQQLRPPQKFNNYQNALREIRKSLMPFANESGPASGSAHAGGDVNRQMLQDLVNAGCDQEMAVRALKQTGSRNIEAALEFISKMGYLDARNEQIVRVIKQTSPGKGGIPNSVDRGPALEGPSDAAMPPYHQMGAGAPLYEGPGYGAPEYGPLPPAMSAQNPPGNPMFPPAAQQKAYPGNVEQAMMSYPVPSQPLQLQPPPPGGPGGPHYDYSRAPHLMEPSGYGVQRSSSFQNKMAPQPDNYVNMQGKGPLGQNGGGASVNLDLYEHHWAPQGPVNPEGAPARQPQGPFRGEVRIPSRTNSFNNHQKVNVTVRQNMPAAVKQDPALGPPNTITAVTSPPIQQPVKSIRVMRPEPKTAVGPCHPGWLATQTQDVADSHAYAADDAYALEPSEYCNPEPRCPPPPYPKTLLMTGASAEPMPLEGNAMCAELPPSRPLPEETLATDKAKAGKAEKVVKDKKQIQTSPVPVRKNARDEEKRESRIKSYSPFAFKFYMEQHVENIMKTYQQKLNRRLQLEQEMSKAGLSEAEQEQMRKMLYQKESNYNRLKRAKMDKSMFVKIKTLGIGAFGEVCLTRKVDTGALYAMKTLRKKDVLNRNQVAHVKAERDILAEADNEWVVRLYYSFQDRDCLYFVMDYIPGGDMMSLLIRMGTFAEELARFYVAELTLAIESVHRMGFIHRDIKPDNILIDLDGHIKLTDFGLCTGFRWTHNSKYYQKGSHIRQDSMEPSDFWDDVSNCRCGDRLMTLEQRATRQHQRCLAHSLVGTPNYIAPEVLLRKGYTQLCDWWSVGVILFEMLVGQPPFLASTPTETQIKVINWESTLQVPAQVQLSPEAVDFIGRLCCSAEERLGGNGADEIKAHPFFNQMDFSSNLRTQPAPYRPKISHPMDTSNFDPVAEDGAGAWSGSGDSARAWDALGSAHGKHPEHAFYEFTFRRFFDDNGCPFRYPKPRAGPVPQQQPRGRRKSRLRAASPFTCRGAPPITPSSYS
ncbi:hypothetical protein ANANG_G00276190 [Anguilla anguilla]|uniref:non-specific serine/threonine protein kinase n=1 Tax=Anguilla anguilla TaxID=7936 RepID=A0A9D3LMU7_ANGAN|nr:hypothetical protein ANANG_G00276190 [Anguilla anguilla]